MKKLGLAVRLAVLAVGVLASVLSPQGAEAAPPTNKLRQLNANKLSQLTARLKATGNPYISSVGITPLSQGQTVVIAGRNFGDVPGSVMLKGNFMVNGTATSLTVDLPLTGGIWEDTVIAAGPIPTNLIGLDQDISIQVKSKGNTLSNEKKAAFTSQREIKLLPNGAMTGSRCELLPNGATYGSAEAIAMEPGVTNTMGVVIEFDAIGQACPFHYKDIWSGQLRDYQKFDSWVFGHWVGNFPQEPTFFGINNHLVYSVNSYLEHFADYQSYNGMSYEEDWVCNAGYWVNLYYTTPTGMD